VGDTCRQAPSASDAIVSASIAWRDNPLPPSAKQYSNGFVAIA